MTKVISIEIKKPLYGTFCYINEDFLNKAIKFGYKVEVQIPQGKSVVDPQVWKDTGKRMEKVFKRPDQPMILWGNTVKLDG